MTVLNIIDVLPFDSVEAVADRRPVVDDEALAIARAAIDELNATGASALWRRVDEFDERPREMSLRNRGVLDRDDLRAAVDRIDAGLRCTLERTAVRIRDFAMAQRSCLQPLRMPVSDTGLVVGHDLVPI